MLTPTERRRLERGRTALRAQLRGLGNLMRGTIVRVGVQCGRPGCACAQGAKHEKILRGADPPTQKACRGIWVWPLSLTGRVKRWYHMRALGGP